MARPDDIWHEFGDPPVIVKFGLRCATFCIGLPPPGERRLWRWTAEIAVDDGLNPGTSPPYEPIDADELHRLALWLDERAAELTALNAEPIYGEEV